jgi:leucyl/phenylalanyl-tRNA---protein transferase
MNENKNIDTKELLKPGNMLRLYASGAFPMADDTGRINWFMPEIRTIIPLDNYNIPRSLKNFLSKSDFEYKFDTDYINVIRRCATREKTWISEELIEAYMRLYRRGHLHTVETYQNGRLIGGLYGVTFRGAFFGESMFSKVPQASKAALIKLIEHLNEKDFLLLDVQYMTPHLKMFGAVEIGFDEYNKLLYSAYTRGCEF